MTLKAKIILFGLLAIALALAGWLVLGDPAGMAAGLLGLAPLARRPPRRVGLTTEAKKKVEKQNEAAQKESDEAAAKAQDELDTKVEDIQKAVDNAENTPPDDDPLLAASRRRLRDSD